jgi:hypothetical protein
VSRSHIGIFVGYSEAFEDYTAAFRVPFRVHTITDTTFFSTGQVDSCKAKFLILDLDRMLPCFLSLAS